MNDKIIKIIAGTSIAIVSYYIGSVIHEASAYNRGFKEGFRAGAVSQEEKMRTEQQQTWKRMGEIADNYKKLAETYTKRRGR